MTLQNGLNQKLEPILWPRVEILGSKNDPSEQPKSIPKANSLTPCRKFVVQKNPSEKFKSRIFDKVSKFLGQKNDSSEQPK